MAQNALQMTADEALTKRINAANSPDEVRAILEDAMSRGNIANRDPETGRFVPTGQTQQQQQTAAVSAVTEKQPVVITKTVTIGGQEMQFSGTELEVAHQIAAAHQAADAVKQQFTTRKSAEHVAMEKAQAEMALRRGEITAAEFLEKTNAISDYLRDRGVDIEQIASERYTQSWAEATTAFLQDPTCDWPGGEKNRELLGMTIQSLGLEDAEDKLAAMRRAYAALKEKGLLQSTEPSPEVLERMTERASPAEILEAWKQSLQGDAETANEAFIDAFHEGRKSSGVFGS